MSYLYTAHLLHDNDGFSDIDFGASASEATVARLALRLSNAEQHDTCVVRRDTVRGNQEITQRIRWKGLAVVEKEVEPQDERMRQLGAVGLLEALDAARVWCDAGYTVVISPSVASPALFHVVGRK